MTSVAPAREATRPATPARSVAAYVARLALVAIASLMVAYLVISVRVAEQVTHVRRAVVGEAVPNVAGPAREVVTFSSTDGLRLSGWFYRTAGDRAVIFVHGKDSNRLEGHHFERLANILLPNGYSMLTFDLRGHGDSDGDRFSLGQHERNDVAGAIGFLESRGFAPRRIALIGHSMGAGTVLQAVATRPDVGPVIADSGFSDGRVVVGEVATSYTGLPSWFNPGLILAAKLFDIDIDQIAPATIVRAHPERAYLFIHCELDATIPSHHSSDLAAASANPATRLWIASGCAHVQAIDSHPAEYDARVVQFLAANMR
jgi:pimeloyl-ACP methyl ester carboxylesterase